IILGTRNSGGTLGTNVAILRTTDTLTFTATTIATDVVDENPTAGGIAFGSGNTFWAKNLDSPLRLFSFDLGTGLATTLHSYGSNVVAGSRTLEALAVDTAQNLLAVVDFTSSVDHIRLYDISDLNKA